MFLFQLFFAQFDQKILKYNISKIAQITHGTQASRGHLCIAQNFNLSYVEFSPQQILYLSHRGDVEASVHHHGVLLVKIALSFRSPRRSFVASWVRRHSFAALRLVPGSLGARPAVAVDHQRSIVLGVVSDVLDSSVA